MDETCLFCRIVKREIPAKIIHRTENIIVFHDVNPEAPVHVLLIPTRHISSLYETETKDQGLLGEILVTAKEMAEKLEIGNDGFRIVINSGRDGGQTVDHLHFHLLGGRPCGWPPG